MKSKKTSVFKRTIFLTPVLFLALIFSFTNQTSANPGVEVLEKRTLTSKTFENGDGTFTFQAHMGHIHYVDKVTGRLKECDTILIDMGDKWIQTKASYHCEIPKYADGNFLFTDVFEEKSQTLTMKPLAQHILGKIDNSDGWINKRVLYRNAFGKGLHLRVTAGNVGLFKEVIIDEMPSPLKDLSFDFEILLPSEEHVYVQYARPKDRAVQVALANHTVTGNKQILIGQGPIEESAFSYIRQIRIWDSGDNAINGHAQFYQKGSSLYFRKTVPKEFLATATYPVYTDDVASYYSGVGDGYVAGGGASNDWNTAHDRATGNIVDYTSTASNGLTIASGLNSGNWAAIYRGFFPIDATALPDDANIAAGSLFFGIYSKQNDDNDGYDYIAVVGETTQASPTSLTTADYDTCGAVDNPVVGSAKYDITSIVTGQYLEMVLNDTGISWIRKSGTGDDAYSRFGVREGHDIKDHPYTGGLDTWNFVKGPQSDFAGTQYDPYLSVIYNVLPTTHYVDGDNGDDGANYPYTLQSAPAQTIQAAIDACPLGTVYVRKVTGDYSAITMRSRVDVKGRDESWNEPDAPDYSDCPTINGDSVPAVTFGGPLSNCTSEGFKITGGTPTRGQILVTGKTQPVTEVTINHCWFYDANTTGIILNGAVAASILGCDIDDPGTAGITVGMFGDPPYITETGYPVIIKGNKIYAVDSGIEAGIRLDGNGVAGGAVQLIIGGPGSEGNEIYNMGRAGICLYNFKAGSTITIENNDIHGNGTRGIPGPGGESYAGILVNNIDAVTIKNNDIYDQVNSAGIAIGESNVTVGASLEVPNPWNYSNDIHNNYAGIFFETTNSLPVTIRGNYIYNNQGRGGIQIKNALTGTVTITQNDIDSNNWGGIGIQNDCIAVITRNNIHGSTSRGGIHTGDDTGAFFGTAGGANLTIRQNKVHDNNSANYGGGIDVRYASGVIENNLVYKNGRGGIRIGKDITDVINNTVVWNGFNNTLGGGIVYDDPATGLINDPPDKTYTDPTLPFIRNNICAYNRKAGIAVVFDNTGYERDYNLLYDNWYGETVLGYNYGDCSWTKWPGCKKRQLGGAWPVAPNEIFGDPLFETGTDNYHLQSDSPAVDAGDTLYGTDVSIPPGVGTSTIDMGAYGGPYGIIDAEIP